MSHRRSSAQPGLPGGRRGFLARLLPVLCLACCGGGGLLPAQTHPFDAAPPGLTEAGIPAFVVLGPESMGLGAPPTDLRQLPDGRVLVVARNEIAIGDGVRWEVFRQAAIDRRDNNLAMAVAPTGELYAGVQGGIGRVDFGTDGRWRFTKVASLPAGEAAVLRPSLTNVATTETGWFWHSGSGSVVAWRPGESARIIGGGNSIERVFTLGQEVFASSRSDGSLLRLANGTAHPVIAAEHTTANATITSSTPLDPGHLLVGTNAEGFKIFDGARFAPFPVPGLAPDLRVNDVCATDGGYLAAALDNTGIVFFDHTGRIVQSLDRTLDHRLSRVQRLFYDSGTLWALLNDGVARIRFPARLSNFEPLVATGLAFAQPIRHDGRLWLVADGRAQRGLYNAEGRLLRFVDDSPPGAFVHTLCVLAGTLYATNETGLYRRRDTHWELAVADLPYARLDIPSVNDRRWFYVARGSLGWLVAEGDTLRAERHPQPALQSVYGAAQDAAGTVWLELGTRRIGRVRIDRDPPTLEILAAANGVADGWVNLFILDGTARFNVANRLFRYDEGRRYLVEDAPLLQRYPDMDGLIGRPARDAGGRLWFTANDAIRIFADNPAGPTASEVLATRVLPTLFTMETGGVVWLHDTRHLMRYDPAIAEPAQPPLRAIVTRVHLPGSDQHLIGVGTALPPLRYADNSLVVYYLAPGTPFGQPVTFEVRLEGSDQDWVSTGSTGSAVFNRLKEGSYTLHVRPRTVTTVGRETTLAFRIAPPWFRTPLAYACYGVTAVGAILALVWWSSFLERREKVRLELLVARRTTELHETNRRLNEQVHATLDKATALLLSEERYRRLNEQLEQRVQERTAALTVSNRELESFSYSVSHDLRAPLRNISGFADLLSKRLLGRSDAESMRFLGIISTEAVRLGRLIDALLVFSRLGRSDLDLRPVDLPGLVEEARREFSSELVHRDLSLRINPLPTVQADPTLLRQVLVNLLSNALKFTRDRHPALIEIGTAPSDRPEEHVVFVRDNGVGFDPKYADKLFGVFQRLHHSRDFEGTGIGLANVRRIILRHGGRIWAESRPGAGATFFFTLPASRTTSAAPPPPPAT